MRYEIRHPPVEKEEKEIHTMWMIAVVLGILWLAGLVSGFAMGNIMHILFVIALLISISWLIKWRRSGLKPE